MLRLFTDTDTDVTPEVANRHGYRLISMPYSIDEETIYPYESFDVFDAHKFYDTLRSGVLPTTSAISKERYINYFEPEFAAGNDILYVHFSAAMTMTFDVMKEAVAELKAKYPERKFYEIDTKGITIVSYNIVEEVGDMILAGKTVEEVLEWAKTEVDHFAQYFFVDDLKFFKKSGRVSGLAATMGTVIGVKPIIYMDENGKMVSIGKEIGKNKAIQRIMTYIDEIGDDVKGHRVVIGTTDYPEVANIIRDLLIQKFGSDLRIEMVDVNPTAGSHCGPNGVGVSFHSKHR